MSERVTLTGYLGKDREVKQTRERIRTFRRLNHVAEMWEPFDVTIRPRDFIVLSLATHQGPTTTWHRLQIWSPDRNGLRKARRLRKGDQIQVTGRPRTFAYQDKDGVERTMAYVEVESYRVLRLKVRQQVP